MLFYAGRSVVGAHEIVNEYIDIPDGFSTYSILLIPDYDWFNNIGLESSYKFFNRFKAVGDLIGENNLTCWFYKEFGKYGPYVDIEVIAAIGGNIASPKEFQEFINSRIRLNNSLGRGAYDVERARLICSALSLDYSHGPFVAFFTDRPSLPYEETVKESLINPTRVVIRNRYLHPNP
jgi:hypothetical protein